MSKKILYITNIAQTLDFFKYIIKDLMKEGYVVDYACNDSADDVEQYLHSLGCKKYQISCTREPLDRDNIKTIFEIKKIVEEGAYDIVHCHTPIAAMCTRLACRKLRHRGVKVFYTAHGFHFFSGAPLKNWILYYPVEKLCSRWTDVLITINQEDYQRAKSKFFAKKTVYIPGVGIDLKRFDFVYSDSEKEKKREEISQKKVFFLSVGRLSKEKNHAAALEVLAGIKDMDWVYVIAGDGSEEVPLMQKATELNVVDRLILLGRRNDIPELLKSTDIFLFPSTREGLPVALMEAMASRIPILCSLIRGSDDLVDKRCFVDFSDPETVYSKIQSIQLGKFDSCVEANYRLIQSYSIETINKQLMVIYEL